MKRMAGQVPHHQHNGHRGAAERTAGRDDVLNDPNSFGLYELGEVQAPRIDVAHLEAVAPGQFKLTIGVKKGDEGP